MKRIITRQLLTKATMVLLGFVAPIAPDSRAASTIVASNLWNANGHTYYLVQFDSSTDHKWDSARAEVSTLFGDGFTLATITSPEEGAFVRDLLSGRGWEWWVGGVQDPITEPNAAAGWTWVTGEPFLYTN